MNDKGNAVIEATLSLPVFLFFILAIYSMIRCRLTELEVYEACVETAEYMAEYGYVSDAFGEALPLVVFDDYINNDELINRYVKGGKKGVNFFGSICKDGYVMLCATYQLQISLPFIPKLTKLKHIKIKQKMYKGDEEFWADKEADEYVFVAESGEVYHLKRDCFYLKHNTVLVGISAAKERGLLACNICGANCSDKVYVTEEGERYHSTKACSSLKRTVYRIKKKDLGDMPLCHWCRD